MTTLDEAKGTVDKTSGHGKKDPASPFSVGQRVAHYKGMGKTIHGNVVTPHAVSGGTKGAMVKFAHGTEFVPHKDLKDAGQYWKDETDAMYKKRGVNEADELSLRPGATRLKSDMQTRVNKDGTLSDNERRAQKKLKTLMRMTHCTSGLTGPRCKLPEETELEEGSSGTIIHKVTHEGKVKFITKYGKAAEAVAKKIEANTGIPAKITQHIADKNGFYRLHKEDVDYIDEAAEPSSDIEYLRTQAANHEKRGEWEWSQGNHSGANTYYQKANELRARIKSMSVKKVQENADDRWVEYSHDSETGYTCHHIPRYLAKPGEMRFKHTLDGRSELSHSKHYPESMKDEILRKKSKNEGVASDWEEEREEKRKKLAGAMAAVDHLSKNMNLPTGRNYPAWLKRKQDAAKKVRETQGK